MPAQWPSSQQSDRWVVALEVDPGHLAAGARGAGPGQPPRQVHPPPCHPFHVRGIDLDRAVGGRRGAHRHEDDRGVDVVAGADQLEAWDGLIGHMTSWGCSKTPQPYRSRGGRGVWPGVRGS